MQTEERSGVGLLSGDLAMALDPAEFSRRAGIEPDQWQADLLRSTTPRVLLNCSRQSGKSTTVAIKNVHTALYEPGSLQLLISPAFRQSQELFRKCLDVYRNLGRPVVADAENKLTLELSNGSRIVSLPGKEQTVRSFSGVRRITCDEASRIPDDLYRAVRPMLAVSGGELIALSTPWGTRGWWYEAWESAERWERYKVPAVECPRITPEFLAEELRTVGLFWYQQEYDCVFLDAQSQAFRRADIERAFTDDLEGWDL